MSYLVIALHAIAIILALCVLIGSSRRGGNK